MFGYRTNFVIADGDGYVANSQLRRQLAAVALDVHPFAHTVIEGNFSYYNLYQFGYPGWFIYAPTTTAPSVPWVEEYFDTAECARSHPSGLWAGLCGGGDG
jgi:iron complex outermembrane receptor protein